MDEQTGFFKYCRIFLEKDRNYYPVTNRQKKHYTVVHLPVCWFRSSAQGFADKVKTTHKEGSILKVVNSVPPIHAGH